MYTESEVLTCIGIYVLLLVAGTVWLLNTGSLKEKSRWIRIAIIWLLPVIGLVIIGLDSLVRRYSGKHAGGKDNLKLMRALSYASGRVMQINDLV